MPRVFHSAAYKYLLELLIDARRRSGLNQTELGKKVGRRQTFISKYELGERRLDVVEFLILCEVLKVDPHELIADVQTAIKSKKL